MSNTAILVIDVQVGLMQGHQPVVDGEALVERIKSLTDRAQSAGVPVLYIQDKDVGPPDSPEWELHPGLGADKNAWNVQKSWSDAFYQTNLDHELRSHKIQNLIIVGCKTDACVEMTARRAVALGYDVTLMSDGHGTSDNRFMTAAQSVAYYNLILDGFGLEDGFGDGKHSIQVQPSVEITF